MPKPYPAEFRPRAVALVRAGKPATTVAGDLGISGSCLQNWLSQDRIDRGEIEGVPRTEGRAPATPTWTPGKSGTAQTTMSSGSARIAS